MRKVYPSSWGDCPKRFAQSIVDPTVGGIPYSSLMHACMGWGAELAVKKFLSKLEDDVRPTYLAEEFRVRLESAKAQVRISGKVDFMYREPSTEVPFIFDVKGKGSTAVASVLKKGMSRAERWQLQAYLHLPITGTPDLPSPEYASLFVVDLANKTIHSGLEWLEHPQHVYHPHLRVDRDPDEWRVMLETLREVLEALDEGALPEDMHCPLKQCFECKKFAHSTGVTLSELAPEARHSDIQYIAPLINKLKALRKVTDTSGRLLRQADGAVLTDGEGCTVSSQDLSMIYHLSKK